MTLAEARRLLNVEADTDPAALSRAFRLAAKRFHPDHGAGDPVRFREVVDAYKRLKAAPAARLPERRRPEAAIKVRGDDLWIIAQVSPKVMADGGRITLDTPNGKRVVWVTKRAGELGLMRLPGEGLPARDGGGRQGHLFVTLVPREADSPAKSLLRRFAAAWAA